MDRMLMSVSHGKMRREGAALASDRDITGERVGQVVIGPDQR